MVSPHKCPDSTSIRTWLVSSKSFPVHQLSIIIQFDTVQSQSLTILKKNHSPSGEVWIPLFAACDFSAPGARLAGVDSWLPSSELTPPETPLSPDTLPPGDGPSVFWVPGSAGKSSELIVNSLASAVGCLTIPTEINTSHNFKLLLPTIQF